MIEGKTFGAGKDDIKLQMEERVHLKILLSNAVKDTIHVMFLLFASFNLIKTSSPCKMVCVYPSVPEDERHK